MDDEMMTQDLYPTFNRYRTHPCKYANEFDDCDKTVERENLPGRRGYFVCFACKQRQNSERAKIIAAKAKKKSSS